MVQRWGEDLHHAGGLVKRALDPIVSHVAAKIHATLAAPMPQIYNVRVATAVRKSRID